MALPISVTYTFATATSAIPLSQLDANFTTVVNGINGIGNGTNALSNVSITGGAIDGATIGATTSSTGRFSTVTATTGNLTTVNATTLNAATHRSDTTITFQSNVSTTAMTIDASQNVGIGTTSPTYKMDIQGAAGVGLQIYETSTGTNKRVRITQESAGITYNATYSTGGNSHIWQVAQTEYMRLDNSGNVGIGTSSPAAKLQVNGTTDTPVYFYTSNANNFLQLSNSSYNWYVGAVANNLTFTLGGSGERARIDSSGNLMVGGTSALNGNARFSVWNSAGNSFGIATGYGTGTSQFRLIYITSANNNLNFDNGANVGYLSSAGAWTNASDARIKNSIVDIKYGINDVMKLQPRSYKMNEVEGEYIGFVAQEIQTVIPEVVSGDPEKQLGVDYGSLAALLTKAIQEQQAQIEELKAKVAALGAK